MLEVLRTTEIMRALSERAKSGNPHARYYESRINLGYHPFEQMLSKVAVYFSHFTDHSISHSISIISNISTFLGEQIASLTSTDLYLIVASALAHDIGMVISESELDRLEGEPEFRSFLEHYRPDTEAAFDQWCRRGIARGAFSEYVRRYHARRSEAYVLEDNFPSELWGGENKLRQWIGKIAAAHGGSFSDLTENSKFPRSVTARLPGGMQEKFNPRFVALCLRLGDLLDIGTARACPLLRNLSEPLGVISSSHWDQYEDIEVQGLGPHSEITIAGTCPTQKSERVLREWISWLEGEIAQATALQNMDQTAYHLSLGKVQCKVSPKLNSDGRPAYEFLQFRLNLDEKTVFERLFGKALYGRPEMAIRELLQNAIDAQRALLLTGCAKSGDCGSDPSKRLVDTLERSPDSKPICIALRKERNGCGERTWLDVIDYGIGMTRDVIQKYLLHVGRSRWGTDPETSRIGLGSTSIGSFGIGFISALMIADQIVIDTQSCFPDERGVRATIYSWQGYLGTEPSERESGTTGTTISLRLLPTVSFGHDFDSLVAIIAENIPYPDFSLQVKVQEEDAKDIKEAFVPCLSIDSLRPEVKEGSRIYPLDDVGSWFALDGDGIPWETQEREMPEVELDMPVLVQDGMSISELGFPDRSSPERAILADRNVLINLRGKSRVELNLARNLPEAGSVQFWRVFVPRLWSTLAQYSFVNKHARVSIDLLAEWRMLLKGGITTLVEDASLVCDTLEGCNSDRIVSIESVELPSVKSKFGSSLPTVWILPSPDHHRLSAAYFSDILARQRAYTFTRGMTSAWTGMLQAFPFLLTTSRDYAVFTQDHVGSVAVKNLLGCRVCRSWIGIRPAHGGELQLVPSHVLEPFFDTAHAMGMSLSDFFLFVICEGPVSFLDGEVRSSRSSRFGSIVGQVRANVQRRRKENVQFPSWLRELQKKWSDDRASSEFGLDDDDDEFEIDEEEYRPDRHFDESDGGGDYLDADEYGSIWSGANEEADPATDPIRRSRQKENREREAARARARDEAMLDEPDLTSDVDDSDDGPVRDRWSLDIRPSSSAKRGEDVEEKKGIGIASRSVERLREPGARLDLAEALIFSGFFYVGIADVVSEFETVSSDSHRWRTKRSL